MGHPADEDGIPLDAAGTPAIAIVPTSHNNGPVPTGTTSSPRLCDRAMLPLLHLAARGGR